MKKTKQVHLYLEDETYNKIKQAAETRSMNVNVFIRFCCGWVIDNTYVRNYKND